MYKFERYRQLGLADFNQPVGLKMNRKTAGLRKQTPFHVKCYNKVVTEVANKI